MIGGQKFLKWLIPLVAILHRVAYPNSASAACDFSFLDGNRIYNYTLTSPVRDFPHGICSEDGYYEVAANETILWFQATELRHPSGCAVILNVHGRGWGWFVTLITIVLCLFGVYLLSGIVYRHFFLGIRGIDVIPNLDFWSTLLRRTQGFCASLARKFKGPSQGYSSSYSPVNF